MQDFLNVLFDTGQQTCFGADENAYRVFEAPAPDDTFFCINALDSYEDRNPTKEWHRPDLPRRADHNVTCFRNFLIELDGMPLEQQIAYVTSQVPVTSIVYSGGKSYHFIISLQDALPSLNDYRQVARRLHTLLSQADPACKNPSRLSRLPGVLRPDTGKRQTLHMLGSRVPNEGLLRILPNLPLVQFEAPAASNSYWLHVALFKYLDAPDRAIAELGLGGRNAFFFWLGNRLAEAGADASTREMYVRRAYQNLQNTHQFDLREALQAARIAK